MKMKNREFGFATWFRAFGVVLILLCHFAAESASPYISMTSQIFNIGNYVFLILSGFLFGVQGELGRPFIHWYGKRFIRIYIPYEMMVVFLFCTYCVIGAKIIVPQWILQFLGLQGWNGVQGAGHTWFVTSILVCYIITPWLSQIMRHITNEISTVIVCAIALAIPLILMIPVTIRYFFTLSPIATYALAYVLGRNFTKVRLDYSKVVVCILGVCMAFAVRLIGKMFWDGTKLYTYVIVTYTHMFAAFFLMIIFAVLFKKVRVPYLISRLSEISFEIYLWHYMFTVGPLRLFGISGFWMIDSLLVALVAVAVAMVTHWIGAAITNKCVSATKTSL